MNAEDIYNGLLELVGALMDRDEVTEHRFRLVGNRQYATELRVWFESGLVLQVIGSGGPLGWAVHLASGSVPILASSYQLQKTEPKRYEGRGWRTRLIEDVIHGLSVAADKLDEDR
jgi:hypothetical protein